MANGPETCYEFDPSIIDLPPPKSSREFRERELMLREAALAHKRGELAKLSAHWGYLPRTAKDKPGGIGIGKDDPALTTHKIYPEGEGPWAGQEFVEVPVWLGKARLADGKTLDPVMVIPHEAADQVIAYYDRFTVGGAVDVFQPTPLLLPAPIRDAALDRPEIGMGRYIPLLVSVNGRGNWLVPPFARFAQSEDGTIRGSQVDPGSAVEPDEGAHRLGAYRWLLQPPVWLCVVDRALFGSNLS